MKQNAFRRILALILTFSFLIGGGVVSVAAAEDADSGSSVSETSLADVRELLNANSYGEYCEKEIFVTSPKAESSIVIDTLSFNADATTTDVYKVKIDPVSGAAVIVGDDYVAKDGEEIVLFSGDSGELVFDIDIPKTAKYSISIEYYPLSTLVDADGNTVYSDKAGSVERILRIDGKIPFSEARYLVMTKVWKNAYTIKMATLSTETLADGTIKKTYADTKPFADRAKKCGIEYEIAKDGSAITLMLPEGGWTGEILDKISAEDLRFFTTDIDGNEIRCTMERIPEFRTFECKDVDGFYTDSFEFVFEEGQRELSLESKNQAVVIKSITLFPQEDTVTYSDMQKMYKDKGYKKGTDSIKFEAEYTYASSSQTIYPIEDASSAVTSPANTKATVLNTIGGEKWQTSGQWVRYTFKVDNSGLYQISARFRQNINDGIFSSRALYLYSEGLEEGDDGYYNGVPFDEAKRLRFGYNSGWQMSSLYFSTESKNSDGSVVWNNTPVEFYFKAGVTYTMEFEVSLGDMGSIVSETSLSLSNINNYYLNILKLTGADPDEYRDYGFYRIMPETMQGLVIESRRLYNIAEELKNISGEKSSSVATLEKVAWLLNEMAISEDNVAKYLSQLKTYIGTLGTWINTAKTQPLEFDYFIIQSADVELPPAKANFFQAVWHEICKFWQSFFRNYDRMGATTEDATGDDAVEVWLAKGRDQTQVIRNLINNDFTLEHGYLVNLKLVVGSTLLPSILANSGPDVYIGIGEDTIINYAIRGALMNIENFDGFYDITSQYQMEHRTVNDYIAELKADKYIVEGEGTSKVTAKSIDGVVMYTIEYNSDGSGTIYDETPPKDENGKTPKRIVDCSFSKEGWLYKTSEASGDSYIFQNVLDENGNKVVNPNAQFNEAAMYVLGIADSDNVMHYYGLPEEQTFMMMFVRNDILADLGIEIPKTWDDVQATIPILQANNMEIGMPNEYRIFMYQKGSELFADDGMRINLDSNAGIDSFEYMCNLFTMYSFPYSYDFANRFRTGEMPIGFAGYGGTYNQLIVFATEIRGLWSFYPIPGIATERVDEEGNVVTDINNVAVATVSAISMINGCDHIEGAWEFMKWHVGAECQVDYSNEMVAILGDSAKYSTANITALESMPWTTDEYEQLQAQFNNLASIPNYPGSYIIGRYTKFAFLSAYNDKMNPADAIQGYINTINKEITRKREEFDLETLEIGETLAEKRINMALKVLDELSSAEKSKYSEEIKALRTAINGLKTFKAYVPDKDIVALMSACDALRATQYSKFYDVADYIEEAADALRSYQASY